MLKLIADKHISPKRIVDFCLNKTYKTACQSKNQPIGTRLKNIQSLSHAKLPKVI